jgi:hypothetical protein
MIESQKQHHVDKQKSVNVSSTQARAYANPQVFPHVMWAHDSKSLRQELERALDSPLRVLRPVFRGAGDQQRCVYGVVAREVKGALNSEAERMQGGLKLFGPVWILCRSVGRYVRDYDLGDYFRDFVDVACAE